MATIVVSQFRPYVQPEVPGCPVVMVDDALIDACRRFSEDTWIINEDLATIPTVAAIQSYALTPAQGGSPAAAICEVFGVKTVVIGGAGPALTPIPEHTTFRYDQTSGTPTAYWFKEGRLWLYPTPDAVVQLSVEGLTRPLKTTSNIIDTYAEHRESISCWAKYKLMSAIGAPWSNPDAALANYRMYRMLAGEQRAKSLTGRVASALRVTPNFF